MDVSFNVPYGHCSKRNCKVGRYIPNTKPLNYVTSGNRSRGYCDDCYLNKKFKICDKCLEPMLPNITCKVCLKDYCNKCYEFYHRYQCCHCNNLCCCYVPDLMKVVCDQCI